MLGYGAVMLGYSAAMLGYGAAVIKCSLGRVYKLEFKENLVGSWETQ